MPLRHMSNVVAALASRAVYSILPYVLATVAERHILI